MTTPKRTRYSKYSPSSSSRVSNSTSDTQRVIKICNDLLEAGNRSLRKASDHNAIVWPFCYDVTIKIFSMLDTASLCNAAATCLFFNKCARDPLCYADIDLVFPKAKDVVVSELIYRATTALRSIKLGDERLMQIEGSSILTGSFLNSLTFNRAAPGLRRLHLYNIGWKSGNAALLRTLSICQSLIDLEIVCFDRWTLTLESVSKRIPLVERLIFESVGPSQADDYDGDDYDGLEYSTCSEFVLDCPNITTLAPKGFKVPDSMAHELIKGLHKLKYVDFSTSYSFTGSFLENLGSNGGGNNLEVMILCDTRNLKKVKVTQFMTALLAGDWKSLSHLDISHTNGLASSKSYTFRQIHTRPNFHLVAEFGKSSDECLDEFDLLPSRKITKK